MDSMKESDNSRIWPLDQAIPYMTSRRVLLRLSRLNIVTVSNSLSVVEDDYPISHISLVVMNGPKFIFKVVEIRGNQGGRIAKVELGTLLHDKFR